MPSNDSDKKYICPVCGFDGLAEPAYDETGSPSFEICPSCGTEFGYHDATQSHEDLRKAWISHGAAWKSEVIPPPKGWDPFEQLKKAGLG